MTFGEAVDALRYGHKITRAEAWQRGEHVGIRQPDELGFCVEPWIYRAGAVEGPHPWLPTHRDILALDWEVVN